MKRFLNRNQSLLIASGIVAALVIWLLSGGGATGAARDPALEAPGNARSVTRVRVQTLQSQRVSRDVIIYGRTEPARAVTMRAEIDGRVVDIGAERGARVEKGEMIVRLDIRDREALLQQARAAVSQHTLQYRAAKRLEQKNFQSETAVAEALANLEAARAAVKRIQVEISNAELLAPFDGVLDQRPVEIGDYVSDGNEVARILELNPILVTGDVTQQELEYVKVGAPGHAKLITGGRVQGLVHYVASESDEATRTFRVELQVPNPDGVLVSGITAEMRIPTRTFSAHYLSAALLSLNGNDEIGVKSVDDDNVVVFHPVEIVRSASDGVWVTGLPDRVRVITVGQGFVREGEHVDVTPEDMGGSASLQSDATPRS